MALFRWLRKIYKSEYFHSFKLYRMGRLFVTLRVTNSEYNAWMYDYSAPFDKYLWTQKLANYINSINAKHTSEYVYITFEVNIHAK